jgi:hypothetical protein
MSKVGQKDTGPEMKLRRSLHKIGLRYRLHDKRLPGSTDIVFPRFKAVVFVHGCFLAPPRLQGDYVARNQRGFRRKKFDETSPEFDGTSQPSRMRVESGRLVLGVFAKRKKVPTQMRLRDLCANGWCRARYTRLSL